ncbi:hypothetical protein DAI22_09g157350 [Oryza sativa Japonica Group]|nr:hypothetical protein DAI22_09g157350 [Oryza sativa Japonica Group]
MSPPPHPPSAPPMRSPFHRLLLRDHRFLLRFVDLAKQLSFRPTSPTLTQPHYGRRTPATTSRGTARARTAPSTCSTKWASSGAARLLHHGHRGALLRFPPGRTARRAGRYGCGWHFARLGVHDARRVVRLQ